MLQLSVLTPGCIHLAGIYFSCLNIFSIFLEILHWPGKKQIIMSQIVLILLFSCLLGLFASNLWCCICALEDFYICSLADFCICRLALFHFPKHLFSVELWLVNSCKCKSMKCLLHTVLPHSNMGWLHTQDNKLANVKATWVQLFFHVTWRAKVFFASIPGIYEIWECSGPKIVKSLAVLSAWQQRKYFDTSAEPSHKHTVLEAPWKWW